MKTENNILVAKFLGWKTEPTTFVIGTEKKELFITPFTQQKWVVGGLSEGWEPVSEFEPNEMLFSSDWSWLMAVVDKIKSMGYYIDILIGAWTIVQIGKGNGKLFRFEKDKTIEAVYDACVEFIKWYNQQNQ